ncbi:hypothetical protein BC938DRAFT_477435 [Jimgerdemannia flammicorona]|uniref:Uncharacterized protein n=1 Tax=Jimgerdemannia flammicorona TaxID=994334 RepID=A0A433PA12_9FUNG|nr:hypothetical protein BC938DRAFT_477435 [Jimgerdemannia flammicorona]
MNNYSRGSSAATNTSNSGYDPASNYSGPGAFAQPGALQQPQQQADDAEEQVTQLTLAGLTVLMVRKKDQVIYKLPDNMSVDSLSSDQRKLLMDQITTLHAATLSAATTTNASHVPSAPTPIAPRNAHAMAVTSPYTPQQNGAQLQQMIEAQQLKMKQMEEEARRRQEQLQQLTPLARRQQQQQQQQQQGTAGAGAGLTILPTPGTLLLPSTTTASQAGPQTPEPTASTIGGEVKTTRKYIKTGKYSKKRIYAQQGQQNPEQYGGMVSSLGGSAVMAAMVAAQQHQQNQQNQQAVGAGLGMPGSSAMNPLVASSGLMSGIGSVAVSGYQQPGVASAARKTAENEVNANGQKRLPEEVAHHQEVKRRWAYFVCWVPSRFTVVL